MEPEFAEHWLMDMRRQYLAGADRKILDLASSVALYLEDPSSEQARRALHGMLHNLIGSGGSYGFPEVSSIARSMSDLLKRSRSSSGDLDLPELSRQLEESIESLRRVFDNAGETGPA